MLNAQNERKAKRWESYWIRHPWNAAIVAFIVSAVYLQAIVYPALFAFTTYWVVRFLLVRILWREVYSVPGPPANFLFGNLGEIDQTDPLPQLVDWAHRYKGFVRIFGPPGFPPVFIIHEPDVLRKLMSTNDTPKGIFYDALFYDWLGLGLLTSNGELWKRRRRLLTPAFHFEILKKYVEVFQTQARVLIDLWEKEANTGKSVDVFPFCTHLTLDVITQCAFGTEVGAQLADKSSEEYVKAVYECSELSYYRMFRPYLASPTLFSLTPQGRRFQRAVKTVHALPDKVIAERRKVHSELGEKIQEQRHKDFLDLLLSARDQDSGEMLDDMSIREEVDTFMFEGHDTTAAGLAWTLLCMGQNPEAQRRAQEEIDRVLGSNDAPTYDQIGELRYLELCLKESLRLFPPVSMVIRQTNKPMELLPNITFPAQTELLLMPYALHRDPRFWNEPEKFIPERFETAPPPFTYIPFAAGNRNCIGQHFATLEEKTLLAMILKKYSFRWDESKPIKPSLHLILRPAKGVHLYITKRE